MQHLVWRGQALAVKRTGSRLGCICQADALWQLMCHQWHCSGPQARGSSQQPWWILPAAAAKRCLQTECRAHASHLPIDSSLGSHAALLRAC